MKRRKYNTLGRRILAILGEGGPRSRTVLLGFARSALYTDRFFENTIHRLIQNGLIVEANHRRGGLRYALPKGKA